MMLILHFRFFLDSRSLGCPMKVTLDVTKPDCATVESNSGNCSCLTIAGIFGANFWFGSFDLLITAVVIVCCFNFCLLEVRLCWNNLFASPSVSIVTGLSSERGPDEVKLMDWIFHSKASAVIPYIWQMDAPESSLDFFGERWEKRLYIHQQVSHPRWHHGH